MEQLQTFWKHSHKAPNNNMTETAAWLSKYVICHQGLPSLIGKFTPVLCTHSGQWSKFTTIMPSSSFSIRKLKQPLVQVNSWQQFGSSHQRVYSCRQLESNFNKDLGCYGYRRNLLRTWKCLWRSGHPIVMAILIHQNQESNIILVMQRRVNVINVIVLRIAFPIFLNFLSRVVLQGPCTGTKMAQIWDHFFSKWLIDNGVSSKLVSWWSAMTSAWPWSSSLTLLAVFI